MIQFPAGPPTGLPQLGVESLAAQRILPALADLAHTPLAPTDVLQLGKAATAALDLELLQTLPGQPARATGAAQYQLALDAAGQGDHAVVLQRLEQAILTDHIYAETARQDPAFAAIRGPVQDLVGRLTVLAGMRADTSIAEAAVAVESAQTPEPVPAPAPPPTSPSQPAAALVVPQRSLTPSLLVPPAQPSPAPSDLLTLPRAALAAVELELLSRWDDPATREMGAIEYRLAREAVQTGEQATAIGHLELAVLAHPTYAAAAAQDPAFAAIREPVRELVNRANLAPHMPPELSTTESAAVEQVDASPASGTVTDAARLANLTRSPDAPDPIPQAQAYLDVARAHFELGTYAGYVVAAQAALVAQRIARESRAARSSKPGPLPDNELERGLRPLKRAAWRAARRLWEKMPLLAILLGWFAAGALAGLLSMPYQEGGIAGMRDILFPVWALGLVAMVLAGFVRSLRRRW